MNNESEIMWELSYINFRYYHNICLKRMRKTTKKTSVKKLSVRVELLNGHFKNTKKINTLSNLHFHAHFWKAS